MNEKSATYIGLADVSLSPVRTVTKRINIRQSEMNQKTSANWGWPLLMAFIRLPMVLLCSGVIVLALRVAGQQSGTGAGAVFATLSVTVTNVMCLGLLLWRARVEGFQLSSLVGFQRRRFLRDLASGVLWSVFLFALLMCGFVATLFAIQKITGLPLGQISMGDADFSFEAGRWLTVFMAIIAVAVFPILNASIEELQYRGYAQPRLIAASRGAWLGIGITALGFGLQHVAFAYTLASAPAYAIGFFLWGIGAGIIAYWQQRLAPIIIAHFISNLSFGIVPLVFMLSGV